MGDGTLCSAVLDFCAVLCCVYVLSLGFAVLICMFAVLVCVYAICGAEVESMSMNWWAKGASHFTPNLGYYIYIYMFYSFQII